MRINPGFYLLLLSCFFSLPVGAKQVYVWQGKDGKVNYSDKPIKGAESISIDAGYSFYAIQKVYDGDTVKLQNGTVVRLLGINTPEVEGRHKAAEPGGEMAKRWLIKFLQGKVVRVQTDIEKKDKYGRTLGYLFTRNDEFVNALLLKSGMAVLNIHPPNLNYTKQLVTAEQEAISENKGIWDLTYFKPKTVEYLNLHNYKGWKRIKGQIKSIRRSRKYAYLAMNDLLALKIKLADLQYFPELDSYLERELIVNGWLSRSQGRLSLKVLHPSAITLID